MHGVPIFGIYSKLKSLKAKLKVTNRASYSNITERVKAAHALLTQIQLEFLSRQAEVGLISREKAMVSAYYLLAGIEESVYKQKSQVNWLQLGDRNTAYFHQLVKKRHNRNQISTLMQYDGSVISDQNSIKREFLNYYTALYHQRTDLEEASIDRLTSLLRNGVSAE